MTARPRTIAADRDHQAVPRYDRALDGVDLTLPPGHHRTARPERCRQDHPAADPGHRAGPDEGGVRLLGRTRRHRPRRSPRCAASWATCPQEMGFPSRVHRASASSTTWRCSRNGPTARPPRRGAPGARPGRPARRRHQADAGPVRRAAPAGRPRPGPDRRPRAAACSTSRPPVSTPSSGSRCAGALRGRARRSTVLLVDPPDRGRGRAVRPGRRPRPRTGPVRRRRADLVATPPGGSGWPTPRPGRAGVVAHRHRPAPQRRRQPPRRTPSWPSPPLEDAYLLLLGDRRAAQAEVAA